MPLIITPRQLNQRAELYHQLGIMITAGLTIHKALEHLQTNPPSLSLRAPITQLLEQLDQGHTVSDSVQRLGRWSPSFDLALIDAGERSGRLDACFKLLAVYYRERAQMMRQMMSDMAYPAFLLHFAIFLFPVINLVSTGNFTRFVLMTAGLLLPLYGLVFLIIYACQGRHGEEWRSKLERFGPRPHPRDRAAGPGPGPAGHGPGKFAQRRRADCDGVGTGRNGQRIACPGPHGAGVEGTLAEWFDFLRIDFSFGPVPCAFRQPLSHGRSQRDDGPNPHPVA